MSNLQDLFRQSADVEAFAGKYLDYLHQLLSSVPVAVFGQILGAFEAARLRDGTIYVCGNGGSQAMASHMANDFAIGTRAGGAPTYRILFRHIVPHTAPSLPTARLRSFPISLG